MALDPKGPGPVFPTEFMILAAIIWVAAVGCGLWFLLS